MVHTLKKEHACTQRLRQGDMDNIHAEDGNRNNHANKILTNSNKLLNKFTLSFQCATYSAASMHSSSLTGADNSVLSTKKTCRHNKPLYWM